MKGFFWAVAAVYLLLYFYAVYLYEGFTLISALSILAALGAVAWLLFRGWMPKSQTANKPQNPTEMRWYQSPFPYLFVFALSIVVFVALH